MKYLTEKQYIEKMKKIQRENRQKIMRESLRQEKKKYNYKPKLPSTSKLMAVYLFMILNVVLIYAMVAMWYFRDLSYLGVLITDVAAQVLTYFIYSKKATTENTVGGITYDMAMKSVEGTTVNEYGNSNAVG